MRKEIFIYAIILAAVLIVLKISEASFLFRRLSVEYYLSIIAVIFLVFGIWVGSKKKVKGSEESTFDPEKLNDRLTELGMSKREYEVLQKLAEGLSNKEIGEALFVSENTIKTHMANIFSKLNAKRRIEVINIARERGILD